MAKCYKCHKTMRNSGEWYCAACKKKAGTYKPKRKKHK